ncbi:MAG: hypothetical protein WED10_04440 [Brumimicrobium sp.]
MIFGKKKKLIKNCALYISDKHNHLVIAPRMENKDGLNMEQENSNGFDLPISEEDLGQEIIDAMNKYKFADINLKERKCQIGQHTKLQKANEGAGYAGGIASAAVDGVNCVQAIVRKEEE